MASSVLLQIKQLFGFCGTIRSCRMVGGNRFCFVEYSMPGVSTGCWAVLPVLGAQHARRQSPSRSDSSCAHCCVLYCTSHG